MLMLIAMCAGVALRVYGEAAASLPRVLYHRALAGGGLGGGGEGCTLPPWRASAQLNISRWQYANVSRSVFPDGAPVRHFDSPNANVWGLAESQVRATRGVGLGPSVQTPAPLECSCARERRLNSTEQTCLPRLLSPSLSPPPTLAVVGSRHVQGLP